MAARVNLPLVVLTLIVCAFGVSVATKDPELKQCKHQCKHQRQFDQGQREQCERQCEESHRQKQQREREERESERGRRGHWYYGEEDDQLMSGYVADPEKKLRQCQERCDQVHHEGQEKALCHLRCQQRFRSREEEEEVENPRRGYQEEEEREEQEREQEFGGDNPYVFKDEHFSSKVRTEHGRFDLLQKFTEKSKLLRGIKNFRIGFLEANPHTFIAPTHLDSDTVFFVAKGRGTITFLREDKREKFNIETGDVVKIPAGYPVYLINRDSNEKLFLVKFFNPVNLPGHFEDFHGAGGEDPESFYRAFSDELLEAAFKVDRESFERVFRQSQGAIVKASREQIQALSHHEEGPRIWPFTKEGAGPFNLFRERPSFSNNFGQLWEATPEDFRHLQDLDLIISFANITQGSMAGPYYNSRATKISIVVDGEGYFEMACPHVSSTGSRTGHQRGRASVRRGGSGTASYQKIRSQLRKGTVFIVPAGHPVATVASPNNNLKVLCFEVNAEGNVRFPLAGRRNVISRMEREALELAFGVPAKEVEQVFNKQNEEFFFAGPGRQHRRRGIDDA